MKLHAAHRGFLVPLFVLSLGSCVSSDPYPENWSPVAAVAKGECPDLTGVFNNFYSTSSAEAWSIEGGLIALLLEPKSKTVSEAQRTVSMVSIEEPTPGRLVIKGWDRSQLIMERQRRISRGACSRQGASMSGSFKGLNVENVMGFVTARSYFNRAQNGDLVVGMRSTFTGIALLVPISSTASNWYQFKQIEP
jgi:hypothetical protein